MLLVGLVAAVAILMILSAVAVQNWSDVLRRDREAEMLLRAQEPFFTCGNGGRCGPT